jgi:hypothetical protein
MSKNTTITNSTQTGRISKMRNVHHSRTFESGARIKKREGLAALGERVGRVFRARPPGEVYLITALTVAIKASFLGHEFAR